MIKGHSETVRWNQNPPRTQSGIFRIIPDNPPEKYDGTSKNRHFLAKVMSGDAHAPLQETTILLCWRNDEEVELMAGEVAFDTNPVYFKKH